MTPTFNQLPRNIAELATYATDLLRSRGVNGIHCTASPTGIIYIENTPESEAPWRRYAVIQTPFSTNGNPSSNGSTFDFYDGQINIPVNTPLNEIWQLVMDKLKFQTPSYKI